MIPAHVEPARVIGIETVEKRDRARAPSLVAASAAMRRLLADAERVAARDVTVLVTGESGTGKELVATLLHAKGRAPAPLVRFNCAALPAELAESELFGHARGAFTGAHHQHPGFFGRADGGTLVLDEIGELPPALQAKLLRALQDGEIQPVGAGRTIHVDVRVIASTHRDLAAEVAAGRFREDLYFRLAVVELRVPPLRERREDVPALARELCARYAERFGVPGAFLTDRFVDELARRDWPGNVRELENAIARLVALADEGAIDGDGGPPGPSGADARPLRDRVARYERDLVAHALEAAGGNRVRAARALGIGRATLNDKIRKYRLGGG